MDERDLDPSPLRQFATWFEDAGPAGVRLPEAMALATADRAGAPSVRMVLLKAFDEDGFVFHTNYESRKALDLGVNPRAALLFHWDPLGRQVRIEGPVDRLPAEESDEYFLTRPSASQIGTWASHQSEVITSRETLDARVAELRERFGEGHVPRPPFWGGYRLVPESFEFWQHRDDRLHDRLRYRRHDGGWIIERLSP